jgi:hypothetical protein
VSGDLAVRDAAIPFYTFGLKALFFDRARKASSASGWSSAIGNLSGMHDSVLIARAMSGPAGRCLWMIPARAIGIGATRGAFQR